MGLKYISKRYDIINSTYQGGGGQAMRLQTPTTS